MKQEKSCGVIIFHEAEERLYLVMQNKKAKHWDFPKGHIEQGEQEEETALREVDEEVGLQPLLLPGFRETMKYQPAPGVEKEVVFFLGRQNRGTLALQEEEVSDALFLPYEEALEKITFPNAKKLLEKANNFLGETHYEFALCAPIEEGKVVMQDRRSISKWGEEWGFFGGHLEKGEIPDEALVRETKEELDIEVTPHGVKAFSFDKGEYRDTFYLFGMELSIKHDALNVKEGDGAHVFSYEEAMQLKTPDHNEVFYGFLKQTHDLR